jgi:hypothetical protein
VANPTEHHSMPYRYPHHLNSERSCANFIIALE